MHNKKQTKFDIFFQQSLYAHKRILYVFYTGLVIGLICYAIKFLIFLYYFIIGFTGQNENWTMIGLLTLIDMTMVANLTKMIITGSYQSFVNKVPENTEKVSSGLLKVKMSTSLVGVTAIHLLKIFVEEGIKTITDREICIFVGIHLVFVISSMGLAWIDYIHSKSELFEAESHQIEHSYEVSVEKHLKKCKDESHHL